MLERLDEAAAFFGRDIPHAFKNLSMHCWYALCDVFEPAYPGTLVSAVSK